MGIDDVISLKRLGFSNAEIKAEVQRTKSRFRLTAADAVRLKRAGFDDAMIALLKGGGTPAGKLTIEDIVKMVRQGRRVEQILDQIRRTRPAVEMSIATALDLNRKKVPPAVILALKGKPLGVSDIRRLAATGLSPGAWKTLMAVVGLTKTALAPADALALHRAGVPPEVVMQLKEGRPAEAVADQQRRVVEPKRPTPPEKPKPTDERPYVLTEAEKSFIRDIKARLEAGGSVHDANSRGITALHQAAGRNFVTAADLLIGKGADINATDHGGLTPLMRAAKAGRVRSAYILLQQKAAVDLKDRQGKTAKQYANETGNMQLIMLITQAEQAATWQAVIKQRQTNIDYWKKVIGAGRAGRAPTPRYGRGSAAPLTADQRASAMAQRQVADGQHLDTADPLGWTLLHHAAA